MIGVGDLYGDWSNDASMFGVCFGAGQQNLFGNIQMSSNREWILLDAFRDPSKEVSHLFFTSSKRMMFSQTNMAKSWNLSNQET